uniref:Cathepsin propeptide inhibitor domain-containing protein n=1 Tax=Ananas comosus var. bracteatus TaxID=296719 RepID=A0A6V7QJW2_ANACO|nr:unnamed protein product [Ananas comosus var. bracteatus]
MLTFWKALDERITGKAMPDMGKITMKDDAELRRMHKKWMVEFERRYEDAEEEERRFQIFKKTVEECERHNAKKKGYTFGLNQFSDLSPEELDAMCRPKLYPPGSMRRCGRRKGRRKPCDMPGRGKPCDMPGRPKI